MQAVRDLRDAANSYKEVAKENWKQGEPNFWRMLMLLLAPIALVLLFGIAQVQEEPSVASAVKDSVVTSIPYQQQDTYTAMPNTSVAPDGMVTISVLPQSAPVIPGSDQVWTVEEPPPVSQVAPPGGKVSAQAASGWVLWKHGTMTRYKGPGPLTRSGDKFGWDDMTCAVDDKDWAAMKGKTVLIVNVDDPSKQLIVKVNDTGCLWTGVWLGAAQRCGQTPKYWCRQSGGAWRTCANGLSIVVDLPWNTATKLGNIEVGMLEVNVYVLQ
jgi:hypothetical protein